MSWRDRLREGSWRGVSFLTYRDFETTGGRRLDVREMPQSDTASVSDMGATVRRYDVTMLFLGETYDQDRDAALAALDRPGPGDLVHPRHGTVRVRVDDYRLIESTAEGGKAEIVVNFVDAGEDPLPRRRIDTQARARDAAEAAMDDTLQDFVDRYNVASLAADQVRSIQRGLERSLETIEDVVDGVTGPIAEMIRAPANMAAAVVDAMRSVENSLGEPGRAMRVYEDLWSDDRRPPEHESNESQERSDQVASQRAIDGLLRRSACIAAAEVGTERDYDAAEDAAAAEQIVESGLDAALTVGEPPSEDAYGTLLALRVAVQEDLRERASRLPEVRHVDVKSATPALLVAHREFGDATRDREIVRRNRIRHPGRIPGGTRLEVLDDG